MPLSRINNPFLSSSGAGNASITSPAANTVAFTTATTERMRIDSSGNVGVGVTPSAWSLLSPIQVKNGFIAGYLNRMYVGANNYYDGSNSRYIATDFATRYYQLNGIHAWEAAPSGTAGAAITFTQVLAVEKDKSLALQGATSVTGTGISFPATQSASADANTLDDYEEGTWTPSVTFGGGSTGQTGTFSGFYTKTGNQVFATALINLTNKGSSTGTMAVAGLPFTSISSNANYRAMSSSMNWDTLASSYVYMYGLLSSGATSMEILAITAASASNSTNPTQTNINNTSAFRISITYQTP